jgi:hypothetical protein
MFYIYYVICIIYCFIQLHKKYKRVGVESMGNSPELDSIMVLVMAWVLAPVDISLTWINMYKAAEEVRRHQEKKIY